MPQRTLVPTVIGVAALALIGCSEPTAPPAGEQGTQASPSELQASLSSAAGSLGLTFNGSTSSAATSPGTIITTQTDDMRVDVLVRWAGHNGAGQMLFYNGHSGVTGWGILVLPPSEGGALAILAGGVDILRSSRSLTPGRWQLVSVKRVAGAWSVSVDGAKEELGASPGVNTPGGFFLPRERTMVGRGTGPEDGTGNLFDVFNGSILGVSVIDVATPRLIELWSFLRVSGNTAVGLKGTVLHLANF